MAKSLFLLSAGVALAQAGDDEMNDLYYAFQVKHRRFANGPERFNAFKSNVQKAIGLNAQQGLTCTDLINGKSEDGCVFGVTKFSDMWEDEFKATHLGKTQTKPSQEINVLRKEKTKSAVATNVDWTTKGATTPVKNQGYCGSCWAYSAVEQLETSLFMNSGQLLTLSEQNLISCDKTDGGCNGGDTISAFPWIQSHGGIALESTYPETSWSSGNTGKCIKSADTPAVTISGWSAVVPICEQSSCPDQAGYENTLASWVSTNGPASICVNAETWSSYNSGVYKASCAGSWYDLDHCVQLVGFNQDASTPYWIVRNSWDSDWGVNGHIWLAMGKNQCGVATEATTVDAVRTSGFTQVTV